MSISRRNRRATIYPYLGTGDGGYTTATYGPARGSFWCRFSPDLGNEITAGAKSEHNERGLFEFADSVVIDENDLIVENGVQWKCGPPVLRQLFRAKVVRVFRTSDTPTLAVS